MRKSKATKRARAQQLIYDAMEALDDFDDTPLLLCRQALQIYPDCVDALSMLAQLESLTVSEYVARLQLAVEAGRRDLGKRHYNACVGAFWGIHETRPYMRAMALLAEGFLDLGTTAAVDEAIAIHEQMLILNPDDNQGVRTYLLASYLRRKWYLDARDLLYQYAGDPSATTAWARVLLAHATEGEASATQALANARRCNPHVERLLGGKGRRPQRQVGSYVPGDEAEGKSCALILWDAWRAHPKATAWIRAIASGG